MRNTENPRAWTRTLILLMTGLTVGCGGPAAPAPGPVAGTVASVPAAPTSNTTTTASPAPQTLNGNVNSDLGPTVSTTATADATAQRDACFVIQRQLADAITRFNTANNTNRTDLAALLPELVSGGYLPGLPVDPGQAAGSHTNYSIETTGNRLTCSTHGPAS